MSKLFIVSNRLPITIEKTGEKITSRQSSGGLISAISAYLQQEKEQKFNNIVWMGVPDCPEKAWTAASENIETDYDYQPVFVTTKIYDQYYNGFANSVLWPLFHYFPSFADYQPAYFDAYQKVNARFAEEMRKTLQPDDTVWIHDYHLLPLAGMLRKLFPKLTIGLFLHIPFPSYELYRVLPRQWQLDIIQGMLGADVIGFHTSDYLNHFLNCVEKTTHAKIDGGMIQWNCRQIHAAAFPIGIDYDRFQVASSSLDVLSKRADYLRSNQDKQIIFSVDRLDYTKGIFNRLKGYREFLVQNPAYKGKVVFTLVIVPSRDTINKYAERKKMIDEYIGSFNSLVGNIEWQPIVYHYGHLSFEELVGLYTACDLALITPIRDGMNLVAKEFVASRKDKQGVLILSEMAGAAKELPEALLINPNDRKEIAAMIRCGLEMPQAEQLQRMTAMQERISRYNVVDWARDFFERLETTKAQRPSLEFCLIDNFIKARICEKYAGAQKRMLLLDYDGTLVPFSNDPQKASPDEEVVKILSELSADPKNEVYIVSGRDSYTLEKWLGHLQIGLIAEHGFKTRHRNGKWTSLGTPEIINQLKKVEELMQRYVNDCPGSFIEQKDFSLAWHYRKTDLATGPIKAAQLTTELSALTAYSSLQVLNGHKVIEVKGADTDKGTAIKQLLNKKPFDFILCAGDDQTDEDMFGKLLGQNNVFTIKVGSAPSLATYNLLTPYLLNSLLQNLLIPVGVS